MSRAPAMPPQVPQFSSRWRRWLGLAGLSLFRWRVEGQMPPLRKFVLVVAPHTSNWDFVIGLFVYFALCLDASWLAKHTALRGPFGRLGRYLGGVPVDRSQAGAVVDTCVAEFARRSGMVLAIAPEGTRRRVAEWKRGFHRIAHAAGVPMVPIALDFSARRVRIGAPLIASSDYEQDLVKLRKNFRADMARYPDQYS